MAISESIWLFRAFFQDLLVLESDLANVVTWVESRPWKLQFYFN